MISIYEFFSLSSETIFTYYLVKRVLMNGAKDNSLWLVSIIIIIITIRIFISVQELFM